MYRLSAKSHAWVPNNWLPHVGQFTNMVFLAVVGLCPYLNRDSAMSRLSPEDKGSVDVPTWLSQVYTDDIFKAVEAKKKESSKKSDEGASGDAAKEPTSLATKKRPASSAVAPKPKGQQRPFFKKLGTADAATKPSLARPSTPLAGGGAPIPQVSTLPPEPKETSPKVTVEGDSAAKAAVAEVVTDQVDVPGAAVNVGETTTSSSREGKGKESQGPTVGDASMPPPAPSAGEMFKRMRRAEVANIPPSGGFSSEEKDKILSAVYDAIPEEYLFIRCAEGRHYRFDIHKEMPKHKDQIENHEKYVEKKAREINEDADIKIKSETDALRKAEEDAQDYENKLLEHEERLAALKKGYSAVSERVTNFSSKVDALEKKLKATQDEIEVVRGKAASSFKLGEVSILENSRRAWDQSMDGKDFSWFKRRISYQMAVSTA
ncbi:uncharacterized protein [Spinacia oleracea]|uniref:Uncharacterized protein n=1 Tax=Spinacia oleracea TaxID=3562 RepID=A0ABM3R011_SPIOL|nr:uncharacterized protein LOC130463760 [Spinacia oleracea]